VQRAQQGVQEQDAHADDVGTDDLGDEFRCAVGKEYVGDHVEDQCWHQQREPPEDAALHEDVVPLRLAARGDFVHKGQQVAACNDVDQHAGQERDG